MNPDSASRLIISADDFGLTRHATDSILETVDRGPVTNVSILANGAAVEYALAEYGKRPDTLRLSVHLNLTEGRALSSPSKLPHLTDADGNFKHSFEGLLIRYICAGKETRRRMQEEAAEETTAQIRAIADAVGQERMSVNGHQHVHMLPFVFEALMSPRVSAHIEWLRIPEEPFFFVPSRWYAYLMPPVLKRLLLNALSRKERPQLKTPANDAFIGMLFTGRMLREPVLAALTLLSRRVPLPSEVEMLFHPGVVLPGETMFPEGSRAARSWYTSRSREREKDFLLSGEAKTLLGGSFTVRVSRDRMQFFRYGISGSLAAITHLGGLYILTEYAHIWYVFSNMLAYCGGILISFSLQKFWTFRDRSFERIRHQAFLYVLVQLISLLVNTYGLYLLVNRFHLWYLLAEILMMLLVAGGNFFIFKRVIFRTAEHGTDHP